MSNGHGRYKLLLEEFLYGKSLLYYKERRARRYELLIEIITEGWISIFSIFVTEFCTKIDKTEGASAFYHITMSGEWGGGISSLVTYVDV